MLHLSVIILILRDVACIGNAGVCVCDISVFLPIFALCFSLRNVIASGKHTNLKAVEPLQTSCDGDNSPTRISSTSPDVIGYVSEH